MSLSNKLLHETMVILKHNCVKVNVLLLHFMVYVTRPGKTGLIYTKYTCLNYVMYLLFCMCYPKSVNFIEFLIDCCIYDDILDMIEITDKKLLHVKLSKLGQILHVDKTCFPRPGHKYNKRNSCLSSTVVFSYYLA